MSTLETYREDLSITFVDSIEDTCPVNHYFSDKVYTREILMPAGLIIVGKTHKTRHLNIVLTGECDVMINGELKHIVAPYTFESLEGSQKTLYIHKECRWMTIHVNEDDETNLDKLEERYINCNDEQPLQIIEQLNNYNQLKKGTTYGLGNDSSNGRFNSIFN